MMGTPSEVDGSDMKNLALLTLPLILSACAQPPGILQQSVTPVVRDSALPAPSLADFQSAARPYVIGPLDVISVDVFGVEALTRDDVQVDAAGRIAYPLVGEIDAAGKTPHQLARFIAAQMRGDFVRDPQVTVNLREVRSQIVTVDGQVISPGLYPVLGDFTLMNAVASAGGLTSLADTQDVVIFRTVGGERLAGLYNLEAIRNGAYPDPQLYAADVVIVGDSEARRIFEDAVRIIPLFTTPLVVALRDLSL